MAKVTVSVRISPHTVEKIDQIAALLNTTRGKLVAEVVEEAYGGEITPLEMAHMLLDQNAAEVLGQYLDAVKQTALDESADMREEMRAKVSSPEGNA